MLDGDEVTCTLSGQVEGNLVSLEDTVSVTGVIVSFQVMDGNDGSSRFNGTQDTIVVLFVGQTDEDWLVTEEFGHDLGLTGNGGLDLVVAHLEKVPGGFGTDTDQVTVSGDTRNGFLDVGIGEVLGGQVESGLDLLVAEVVEELTSVIGRSVIESKGDNPVGLTAVSDGSLSHGDESSENKSVKIHVSLGVVRLRWAPIYTRLRCHVDLIVVMEMT